jgi:hypothetical protein
MVLYNFRCILPTRSVLLIISHLPSDREAVRASSQIARREKAGKIIASVFPHCAAILRRTRLLAGICKQLLIITDGTFFNAVSLDTHKTKDKGKGYEVSGRAG